MNAAQARAGVTLTEDRIRRRHDQLQDGDHSTGWLRKVLGGGPAIDPATVRAEIEALEAELAVLREFATVLPEAVSQPATLEGDDAVAHALAVTDEVLSLFPHANGAVERYRKLRLYGSTGGTGPVGVFGGPAIVFGKRTHPRQLNLISNRARDQLVVLSELVAEARALLVQDPSFSAVVEQLDEALSAFPEAILEPALAGRQLPEIELAVRKAGRILYRHLTG